MTITLSNVQVINGQIIATVAGGGAAASPSPEESRPAFSQERQESIESWVDTVAAQTSEAQQTALNAADTWDKPGGRSSSVLKEAAIRVLDVANRKETLTQSWETVAREAHNLSLHVTYFSLPSRTDLCSALRQTNVLSQSPSVLVLSYGHRLVAITELSREQIAYLDPIQQAHDNLTWESQRNFVGSWEKGRAIVYQRVLDANRHFEGMLLELQAKTIPLSCDTTPGNSEKDLLALLVWRKPSNIVGHLLVDLAMKGSEVQTFPCQTITELNDLISQPLPPGSFMIGHRQENPSGLCIIKEVDLETSTILVQHPLSKENKEIVISPNERINVLRVCPGTGQAGSSRLSLPLAGLEIIRNAVSQNTSIEDCVTQASQYTNELLELESFETVYRALYPSGNVPSCLLTKLGSDWIVLCDISQDLDEISYIRLSQTGLESFLVEEKRDFFEEKLFPKRSSIPVRRLCCRMAPQTALSEIATQVLATVGSNEERTEQ